MGKRFTACGRNFGLTSGWGLHVKHGVQSGIWLSVRPFALGLRTTETLRQVGQSQNLPDAN
jgi:hypothetical protein